MGNIEVHTEDYNLELSVLSTFIFERESAEQFIPYFFPQLFSKVGTKTIFKIVRDSFINKKPVDKQYIIASLGETDDRILIDLTFGKLSTLNTLSMTGMMWASERLKELLFFRVANKIKGKMEDEIKKNKMRSLLTLSGEIGRFHSRMFQRESKNFFGSSVDVINDPHEYLSTPYHKINDRIGGWTRRGMSTIGGKSSHNKSTFSIHMLSQSLKLGLMKKGLVVSLDEPGEMVARRIIAAEMDISLTAMRMKRIRLSKEDVQKAMTIFDNKLIIIDNVFTPDEIYEAIMDVKPDQSVVDHLQEPSFGDVGISDPAITRMLTMLKHSAIVNSNNVLVLSQVKDKVIDERIDKVPKAHDFYYSSTIRQKCREQCVAYWRYKDTGKGEHFHIFELYIYKSTYSETGKPIRMYYEPDKARFSDSYNDPDLLKGGIGGDV